MHVEGQVGERDLGLGAGNADGADEQAHFRLLVREHVLDPRPDPGLGSVAAADVLRHRPALGLPAVDTTDPTLGLQPALVALAAVGGIGPDIRGGVVARHHVAQHTPVVARTIGDLAFADEAEGPADCDAAFVAEARDRNIGLWPAIDGGPGLGELQRPARVGVLLPRLGRFVRPDLGGALAPEPEHLGPIVQMGVGDDRARGLDELPMPEHIDQRSLWHGGEARQRRLAAP